MIKFIFIFIGLIFVLGVFNALNHGGSPEEVCRFVHQGIAVQEPKCDAIRKVEYFEDPSGLPLQQDFHSIVVFETTESFFNDLVKMHDMKESTLEQFKSHNESYKSIRPSAEAKCFIAGDESNARVACFDKSKNKVWYVHDNN